MGLPALRCAFSDAQLVDKILIEKKALCAQRRALIRPATVEGSGLQG